jgi:subtilisin-like proprotein convertase family protein
MKRANFTNFLNTWKSFLFVGLFLSNWFAAEAQTPTPGVCRSFRQIYQGPANNILNTGGILTSGNAPLPGGPPGVIEIAGMTADQPGPAVPVSQTIYKLTVAVSVSHPRASELDFMLGYNPPPAVGAASLTAGANTRWVTLSTDNGGNGFASFATFDDDADPGTQIDYPAAQVNNNLVASRDFANAPPLTLRIAPEEPLSQLSGLLATNAAGNGGVFFIAVRDDTPAPVGSTQAFDGALSSFQVTLTTIPTAEYGVAKYTGATLGGSAGPNVNGGGFLPGLLPMANPLTVVRGRDYFSSMSAPDSILNNSTISKTLVATGGTGRVLTDVDVRVALRHTYLGDLSMSLTSPTGTTITLINRKGGNIDINPSPSYLAAGPTAQPATFPVPASQRSSTGHVIYPSLIFSDESDSITVNTTSMFGSPTPITIGSQGAASFFGSLQTGIEPNDNVVTDNDYKFTPNFPYASAGPNNPRGYFQFTPEEGLGALIGESAAGTWTLKITDNSGRDVGIFDRFDVALTTIPKPCVLDVAAGGGVGCSYADSIGSVNITVCSNQFPLDGVFTKVDTFYRHSPDFPVGTTIQVPLGNTVFQAGSNDVNLSTNPRVKYETETFTSDVTAPLYPDPAGFGQRVNITNVKKLNPNFAIPAPLFPVVMPRHGYRLLPRVPASQLYCRWPARIPDNETVVTPALDQNPTDSIGISGSDTDAPTAKCRDNVTITLDTAAVPGLAVVNYFKIDAGLDNYDIINGSSDACTKRGTLQFLNLGTKFGTDCVAAPGLFRINFDNLNTKPGLAVCSDVTVGATHEVKIAENLSAVVGKQAFGTAILVKVKRPTTVGAATFGPIAAGDFKAILKLQYPNGDIVTRTYSNAAIGAPAATGNFDIALAPPTPPLVTELAIIKDVRVETKFNLTAGKISNVTLDLGVTNRDSLRFTTMPRTVSCADIGKPTKIMLVVKDRANNVDTCYTNVTVLDGIKPTITCGIDVTQALPSVNDCSHYLTQAQVVQLGPNGTDACLTVTSLKSPLSKPYSIAPGIGFMLENNTANPIIVQSLSIPIIGNRPMFIRAFVLPIINSALDQTTYPASATYPILPKDALNALNFAQPPAGPVAGLNSWMFWGQNIVIPGGAGTVDEVEFLPKNFSNLTVKPNPLSVPDNIGNPYTISGNKDIGTSLVIPPNTRWGVYLTSFAVDQNGNPVPFANNTSFGIVHSNAATGGITPSYPYPLPPVGSDPNTVPPLVIRAGWNTNTANVGGNEFETAPNYPVIANPAPPAFPAGSPVFESVVNFPLGYPLAGANVPLLSSGGTPRMFAGKVNYVFGETKLPTATGAASFTYPAQGPRATVSYFQKTPVIPNPASNFLPSAQRSLFPNGAIKQILGIDFQKPYPIGKTVNVFQVTDMGGNTATCSQTVTITPAPGSVPPQLICNDLVNLSLDVLCSDTLKATKFLANAVGAKCLGAFKIEITNGSNVLGVQTGTYTGVPLRNLLGGTYDYKVIDAANTNNYCWGKVKFEDKLAPLISCPQNITVDDCSADLATSTELVYSAVYTNPSSFTSDFTATNLGVSSAIVPVNAPLGSKLVSITVETDISVAAPNAIGKLFYNLITPSGGIIQLAAQPGLNAANGGCTGVGSTGLFQYNFSDASTQSPMLAASNYPCPPPNGTYRPLDELNTNLAGIPVDGDWLIQLQEITPNTGATATAKIGGLRLRITMTVPVEKAFVQELCMDNLVPLLGETTKTNTCSADTGIVKVVKRTYTAKDNYGNISSCSHTISFKRAKFANEVFPNDLVLDCTYSDLKANPTDSTAIANVNAVLEATTGIRLPASYKGPWFDASGHPHINVVGKPRPFGCTAYTVNYTDMRIDDICGTGNGSYAVRRTWKVFDACANKAIEREQYISVQDIVAPTITQAPDATFSTPAGKCITTVTLPKPTVKDNCNASDQIDITYELFKESTFTNSVGTQSPTQPNVFADLPTSSVTLNSGVPTQAWYYVRYTATDKCGNTKTSTSRFRVTDLIPPVAVCAPLIKVSLSSDGNAIINAQEFDRGSYDNCGGIANYQVWRLEDGDCVTEDYNQNGVLTDEVDKDGDGFGDYPEFDYYKHPQDKVKFCCADIGDTIMVMFRVWDYSPVSLRSGFRPTEPNYDYGIGKNGNVNLCMSRVVIDDKLAPVVYTQDTTVVCGNEVLGKDWLDLHKPQPQQKGNGYDELTTYKYTSNNNDIVLDNGTKDIKFNVKGLNSIRNLDLNAAFTFNHTNIGNLFAELITPGGTKVTLFSKPVRSAGNVAYTSFASDAQNPFILSFDDEPSLNPGDFVKFTNFDKIGVSGTNIGINDISTVSRKYVPVTAFSKIEGEDLDGQWTLRVGELAPTLSGTGNIPANALELTFTGYPESKNIFYSDKAAAIYSNPDSVTTIIRIPVNGVDTVQDVNIALKMFHTNIGNLSATLTSPQGTTLDLFVQPTSVNGTPYSSPNINGVPSTNIFRLTFNDEPSVNPNVLPQFSSVPGVGDVITPANIGMVNKKYTALGQFSAFDGQDANGDWILTITRLDPTIADSGAVIKGGAQLQLFSNRKAKNLSYYFDNCDDYVICYNDTVRINNCGNGTIKRAWLLTDAAGRTAKDDQFYTSTGRSHYSVVFPKDTVLTCITGSTDTSYTGKPKVAILGGCPTVAVAYKDDIISAVANACYRIKRTWKVANMCQNGMMKGRSNTATPDVALMQSTLPNRLYKNASDSTNAALYPTFDTDGYVEYVQIISVNDKTAPVITDAPTEIKLEPLAKECKVKITIPAIKATDACSNIFTMSWSVINKATGAVLVKVDTLPGFPGSYGFNSTDFGKTFIVRYVVGDRCGNYAVKDYEVTPKDVVKPTPVCYQGLSADILPVTKNVMLAASQFDAGSYDGNDCTAKNNLRLFIEKGTPGFGTAVPTTNMVMIDCQGIVPIRLWVVDAAGNADYCDTYVDVQNNMGATVPNCTPVNPTGSKLLVVLNTAAALKAQIIKNADVKATTPTGIIAATTSTDGYELNFATTQVPAKIGAEKNDNPLNGVSTFDLVLMTKHVLATQPITDSYIKVAADVNNNGKITTADIVELRKMILAIQTGFTNNKSWRFLDNTMSETPTITNVLKGQVVKMTGVKIGDINGSANAASPHSTGTFTFDVNEKVFAAGEEVKATFNAATIAQMEGYQFTLGYDKDALELANIEGSNENFGMVENGSITSSWNGNAQSSDNLFTLVFKAKKAGNLSEVLNINSKFTAAEAYTKSGEYNNVALNFNGAQNKFALYQNQPNPFMGRTVVGFSLPAADHAKMTIYDMAGRLVKTVEGNFNKGYNEVIIDEILGSGVLNYKLETSTETATKSMIILE